MGGYFSRPFFEEEIVQIKKVWLVAGALLTLVSMPGLIDDLQTWEALLSMLGEWQWWNYLLLLAGISACIWSVLPAFQQRKAPSRKKDKWSKLIEKLEPDQVLELEKEKDQQRMSYFLFSIIFILLAILLLRCKHF